MWFKKDNMNDSYILIEIANQLKRIANALEESNNMIKDLGGHHDK